MATATIVVTEGDDGSVKLSSTFDPEVAVQDDWEYDLPAAHYVALGMIAFAKEQLGGGEATLVRSRED